MTVGEGIEARPVSAARMARLRASAIVLAFLALSRSARRDCHPLFENSR